MNQISTSNTLVAKRNMTTEQLPNDCIVDLMIISLVYHVHNVNN